MIPSEKSAIVTDLKREKIWIYGQPGIGKSTFANTDDTLFIATEPGHGKMSCYKVDIASWDDFSRLINKELKAGEHKFARLCIDTVDNLYLMCSRSKCAKLNVEHESDLKWGKGWAVVNKSFEAAIQAMSMLGLGVIFVSHEKQIEVTTQTRDYKRFVPSVGGAALEIIGGYVDHIMRFAIANDPETAGVEKRIIQVEQSQDYMSKSRGDKGVSIFENNMDMTQAAMEAEYARGIKKLMGVS